MRGCWRGTWKAPGCGGWGRSLGVALGARAAARDEADQREAGEHHRPLRRLGNGRHLVLVARVGPADARVVERALAEGRAALVLDRAVIEDLALAAALDRIARRAAGLGANDGRGGKRDGEYDRPVMASHGGVSSDGDKAMARA